MDLTDGNMRAASSSSSNSWVATTVGGWSRGKYAWEMKLDEDTDSQCTCFGVIMKPVLNPNYEHSPEMWMYVRECISSMTHSAYAYPHARA